MNRREAIKALMALGTGGVGASAGCASSQSKAPRTIDDVNVETGWSNLIAKATIESSEISKSSQGIVELGVEWRGETAERFSFGNTIPISSPVMSREPEGVILATEDSGVVSKDEMGWIAEDDSVLTSLEMTSMEFQPNEVESNKYLLWGSPNHFEEIQPGDYRFETSISKIEDRTPENHDLTVDISIS